MSRVYRARDTILDRSVALKLLADASAADAETKARFLQEARLASTTAHENIIAVYDFGEEQGRPFMVMEFLEGESLRDAIRGQRTGDVARKLRIALQVARAIGHIHSKKIVHRDIKPENIHLDPVGRAKLMDFGIAKDFGLANEAGVAATPEGETLGNSLLHASPEQVLGQEVTIQSDVYSFGVLAYELFTGSKPIQGATVEQLFDQILHQAPDMEPLQDALVPPAAIDLIGARLAKQPEASAPRIRYYLRAALRKLGPGADPPEAAGCPWLRRPHLLPARAKCPASSACCRLPLRTENGLIFLVALATVALVVLVYALFAWRPWVGLMPSIRSCDVLRLPRGDRSGCRHWTPRHRRRNLFMGASGPGDPGHDLSIPEALFPSAPATSQSIWARSTSTKRKFPMRISRNSATPPDARYPRAHLTFPWSV